MEASQARRVSLLFRRVYSFGRVVSTLRVVFIDDHALVGVFIGSDGAAFVAAVDVGFKLVQVAVHAQRHHDDEYQRNEGQPQ